MAQFISIDMGMLTLKAVEGVQESSKAMLEYHVLASSLKAMYTMKRKPGLRSLESICVSVNRETTPNEKIPLAVLYRVAPSSWTASGGMYKMFPGAKVMHC